MRFRFKGRGSPRRAVFNTPLAFTVVLAWLASGNTFSYDDDIDYGAPYITVEDGKLVTKDPKQHAVKKSAAPDHPATAPAEEPQQPADGSSARPSSDRESSGLALSPQLIAGGVLVIVLVVLLAGHVVRRARNKLYRSVNAGGHPD
jgi:hypothetical protein